MSINDLIDLVPPPDAPVAASGDWNRVEDELGIRLPDDYKAIISTYGVGDFCNAICIASPFVRPISAFKFWTDWVDFYNDLASYGNDVPYELFPKTPGLLPCGNYCDSDNINWLTAPALEDWRLIYYSRSAGFIDIGETTLVDFVISVIEGNSILPKRIIPSLPKEHRYFTPMTRI